GGGRRGRQGLPRPPRPGRESQHRIRVRVRSTSMAAPQPVAPIVNLNMILDQVAKDKGIERTVLVNTLENAIAQAAKKHFGQDRAIEATYNEDKQVVEVFQTLTVVERVEVEDPVKAVNQISLEEGGKKGRE